MKKRAFTILLAAFITITSIPVPAFGETVSDNTVAIEEADEPELEGEPETDPESGYEPGGAWELDHGIEIPKRVYEDETDNELSPETSTGSFYNPVGEDTRTFASSYDPRKLGKVTSIKNQGQWGICGVYAACATMESALIHQGLADASIDISELYYAYYYWYYYKNNFADYRNIKGVVEITVYDLAQNRYCGPVLESQVPMTADRIVPENITELQFSHLYYLEESYSLGKFNDTQAHRNAAKGMINDYGAISAGYYSYGSYYKDNPDGSGDTSYYDPYSRSTTDHAIEIIGWDDNYAASNFAMKPEGNGAWLVKNSWGERGYQTAKGTGFYWISYYDKNLSDAYAVKFSTEKKTVPSKVSLKDDSLTIQKGQTAMAEVVFSPENAVETGCTYVSSDPKVATVDADGVITAENYGSCTITATSDFFKKTTPKNKPVPQMEMTVTVPGTCVSEIVTPQEEYCIYVDTENLTYDPIKIEASAYPEDATENRLEYSYSGKDLIVSPDGVVTLSDAGLDQLAEGHVVGFGAKIHIKATDGSGTAKTITIRVRAIPKTEEQPVTPPDGTTETEQPAEDIRSDAPTQEDLPQTADPAPGTAAPSPAVKQDPKAQYNGAKWTLKTTGATYKIKNGAAVLVKVSSKKSSFSVPKTVPYRGIHFKVTEISANAFKNNKKLTKVVIGSNVVKIGKKAFYGCTNLKKVTIQANRLSSVGANAFNKISAKAVISIPKRYRGQYKKLLKGKTKAAIKAV